MIVVEEKLKRVSGIDGSMLIKKLGELPQRTCIPVKNLDTGEVFKSAKEASKKYNLSVQAIRRCCRLNEDVLDKNFKTRGHRWVYCLLEGEV